MSSPTKGCTSPLAKAASETPAVYRAISRITAAFAKDGIAKSRRNADRDYDYRSIDDLQGRLAPLLAKHGLVVLPRLLRKTQQDRRSGGRSAMTCVDLHMAFDFVSARDGSKVTAEVSGEAWDEEDKATAKAMTAAYKTAMFQTFCIPVSQPDPDDARPVPAQSKQISEPPEGWTKWTDDKITFVLSLDSADEVAELIDREGPHFQALSAERPDHYQRLCETLKVLDATLVGTTGPSNDEVSQSYGDSKSESTISPPAHSNAPTTACRKVAMTEPSAVGELFG